jgi:ankyrin repeat protein
MTSSHSQSNFGPVQIAQALLDHGANVNAEINEGETSLCQELEGEYHIRVIVSLLHSI